MLTSINANFESVLNQISWADLSKAFDALTVKKRQGYIFTGNSTIDALKDAGVENISFFVLSLLTSGPTFITHKFWISEFRLWVRCRIN